MIREPGYLGGSQYVNPNLLGEPGPGNYNFGPQDERPAALSAAERIEMERIKAEYTRQARADEMVEVARTLEHFRRRLAHIDAHAEAKAIDTVIGTLMLRWHEDRHG